MRYGRHHVLNSYDAFYKWGFGDGDDDFAKQAISDVQAVLDGLDWQYFDVSTMHNMGYMSRIVSPDGQAFELDFCDHVYEPAEIREEMIRMGIPQTLIDALDQLNANDSRPYRRPR